MENTCRMAVSSKNGSRSCKLTSSRDLEVAKLEEEDERILRDIVTLSSLFLSLSLDPPSLLSFLSLSLLPLSPLPLSPFSLSPLSFSLPSPSLPSPFLQRGGHTNRGCTYICDREILKEYWCEHVVPCTNVPGHFTDVH